MNGVNVAANLARTALSVPHSSDRVQNRWVSLRTDPLHPRTLRPMTRRPTGEPPPGSCERPDGDGSHAESSTAPPYVPELAAPELTEAECRRCGTYIAGLDGRYACGVCGWVNDHSEGHRRLPRADEDPDRPPKGRRRPKQLPGPPDPGLWAVSGTGA